MTVVALDYMVKYQVESAVTVLRALINSENFPERQQRWFKVRLVAAIRQLPESYQTELLQPFQVDTDPLVARALMAPASPPDYYPATQTPAFRQAKAASGKVVVIRTNRGEFEITLNHQAVYTNYWFRRWVEQGYYHNTIFSRVIPNFVAQGGEAHGDGSGSVGVSIREEISRLSHQPRTVGIATSGKDTGGAQFFINLAPNLHLDRHYTIIGEVTSGWEVAKGLQMGDWIIEAAIKN
jgi:cyclophilin family peptidyl-prolyl cis-trans isomerase